MVKYANYLIFIFMNINENLRNKGTIIKNIINKLSLVIKPPFWNAFKSSLIQFNKVFHLMVLYENYLICIFMNINEYLKKEGKIIG